MRWAKIQTYKSQHIDRPDTGKLARQYYSYNAYAIIGANI